MLAYQRVLVMYSDGYIDTVSVLHSCNGIDERRFTDWNKTKKAKVFLSDLSSELGLPIRGCYGSGSLIEFEHGGKSKLYMHPAVASEYARFLSGSRPAYSTRLYVIQMKGTNFYKIGISSNPKRRLAALQNASPMDLEIVRIFKVKNAKKLEKELHSRFSHKKVRGEWFELDRFDLERL